MKNNRSQDSLQHNLKQVKELLEKQRLVESIVHIQEQPRGDIVESLVHRQHSVELKSRLKRLHIADIADLLEALPRNDREVVWQHLEDPVAADVLMEVSDPVRKDLISNTKQKVLSGVLSLQTILLSQVGCVPRTG